MNRTRHTPANRPPKRSPRPVRRELVPLFDELRGERVVVRPHTTADFDELWQAIQESKEQLRPWLPFADQAEDDLRAWLTHAEARWTTRDTFGCAIIDRETGRLSGNIGLMIRDWEIGYFEIGYWLRTSATGKGFMTEAVRLITDFAFDHLWANRVEIRCDARNDASAGVPRRLGFTQEAHLRWTQTFVDDTVRDMLVFALIRTDPRWPQ
ncbi:MAG TPA: GNAT family N-acetyltransferase [Ktedonobacterales bacterium]